MKHNMNSKFQPQKKLTINGVLIMVATVKVFNEWIQMKE